MKINTQKFAKRSNELSVQLVKISNEINNELTSIVKELGGSVDICDNYLSSESLIIAYIDDESYTEVERVYITDNQVKVETNNDINSLDDLSANDRLAILDWIIDQCENPADYDMDFDEDEMMEEETNLKEKIREELKAYGDSIDLDEPETIGSYTFDRVYCENGNIYLGNEDGTLEIADAYAEADTDLTFNDFLETILDLL